MRRPHTYILGIGIVVTALIGLAACTPFGSQGYGQPYDGPGGMMGGGMMRGGGMMGGGWGNNNSYTQPLTIDQAANAVQGYLSTYGGKLILVEVMDFAWNYYAEVKEKDTGVHAMELLIDKYTGQVFPEMGPNMMWNTKYSPMTGMMGSQYGKPTAVMPVTAEQATTAAQQYLDTNIPGLTVAEADTFYGYYTLHTLKNGQVEGMLSVNGYTGAIWYHTWHGPFLGTEEYD
ncbi:MAG: hypothetical protein HY662_05150 [Chloroflexi bacterium]|nr:hypothetical protein [Chloroflexota bacterium]